MKEWHIPAKTFLVGEYSAVASQSAIVITTEPAFKLGLVKTDNSQYNNSIHPDSPAGKFWLNQNFFDYNLEWFDPYQGLGGLGASSAQFIGAYLAACYLKGDEPNLDNLIANYYQAAYSGKGLKPSGYDVIAQYLGGIVYINRQNSQLETLSWPFKELDLILIHTGQKLATHEHLHQADLPSNIKGLSDLADLAYQGLIQADEQKVLDAINGYHSELKQSNLVANHTLKLIEDLNSLPYILAIKGCGALGADIVLIVCAKKESPRLHHEINSRNLKVITDISQIFEKKSAKRLEKCP